VLQRVAACCNVLLCVAGCIGKSFLIDWCTCVAPCDHRTVSIVSIQGLGLKILSFFFDC